MRCNACWRELEGKAVSTTCGHLLCILRNEDASKILSTDGACPICDQVLSKSLMRPLDINPNDEWINMAMAGISPQICILLDNDLQTSVFTFLHYHSLTICFERSKKSVMFYMGQKELEMQYKMNRIVAQCRQKCEAMQEKFSEKMEQLHTAYQKMAKRCQMMEQEIENLSKDKQELQDKFAEKSRQKRKLDEMYDQLRTEYESVKRTSIMPASNFYSRPEPDLFPNTVNIMDNRDPMRKDWSVFTPETPGPREDVWPARQNSSNSGGPFDVSGGSPAKHSGLHSEMDSRRSGGARPGFGSGTGGGNPSMTLRNLILSPLKRPQLSRNRPQMFTL